jgi:23S rRNA (guanine2535-N1)-methyltransferase
MPYQYATTRHDYSDYAGGKVFYGLSGRPAFPIRLASEILQRCLAVHRGLGRAGPFVLYDPLCGGGYLLATLAYLHWTDIDQVIGSDVDAQALFLAERNLELLTIEGIDLRMAEIEHMIERYGKASHRTALESAKRLKEQLLIALSDRSIRVHTFQADVMDGQALAKGLAGTEVDILLTDVPYGRDSAWQIAPGTGAPPLGQMLETLSAILSTSTVVAVAADKAQQIAHPAYRRIERFRLGKRQVALLQLRGDADKAPTGRCRDR